MKQRHFGQKVQNWHRPLSRNQLRQRYLRKRYDDPEIETQGSSVEVVADDYWDAYDPFEEHYGCGDPDCPICGAELVEQDLQSYNVFSFLNDLVGLSHLFPGLSLSRRPSHSEDAIGLEKRLSNHSLQICHGSHIDDLKRSIIASLDGPNLHILRLCDRDNDEHFIKLLCLFSPFWIRSPDTWDASVSSLVDHLFVEYETPPFLYPMWHSRSDYANYKWLYWFILSAQGGSLRRASDDFGWRKPPKRFEHFLKEAPADATPPLACTYAIVRCMGGSENEFVRLARNPAFVLDFTQADLDQLHVAFWHETARWLFSHAESINDEECDAILAWSMHMFTEGVRENRLFSISRRDVRRVLRESRQYEAGIQARWYRPPARWKGHGLDAEIIHDADTWALVELTCSEELYREGKEMKHCVAGYASRCAAGHSAIVSMTVNGKKRLTLEIVPSTRRVVQARGTCNRPANKAEQDVITLLLRCLAQRKAEEQFRL